MEGEASAIVSERVRELLVGAPAERAWRRRGYISMCRARCASTFPGHQVRRSQRLRSLRFDEFGEIVREASDDDLFRRIVCYL